MAPRRESRRELAQGRAAAATLASGGSANARRSGRPRPGAAAAGALTVPSTALRVAIDEVASRDPVVADLVAHIGLISHRPRDPDGPFGALVRAIVFQQLTEGLRPVRSTSCSASISGQPLDRHHVRVQAVVAAALLGLGCTAPAERSTTACPSKDLHLRPSIERLGLDPVSVSKIAGLQTSAGHVEGLCDESR